MLEFQDVSHVQGGFAMDRVSFQVPAGSYAALMGRTGSGKTTLLELLCGLRRPRSGRIVLGGRDITGWPPAARGIGYVPQDRALFGTMTVRDNLAFPLLLRRISRSDVQRRVLAMAGRLGIGHLLERYPRNLSGGEGQRVALGRALAADPEVLCLDEPLSALDETTREEMMDLLREIHRESGAIVIHVTHNPAEARSLASECWSLVQGRLVRSKTEVPAI